MYLVKQSREKAEKRDYRLRNFKKKPSWKKKKKTMRMIQAQVAPKIDKYLKLSHNQRIEHRNMLSEIYIFVDHLTRRLHS
jgi:hypothetical protein